MDIQSNNPTLIGKTEKVSETPELVALEDINLKAIDLLSEEKPEEALSVLKKGEAILENLVIDTALKIDKKLLFIILHNMACCYQKLKDFDNCVIYLEAVIFHFDNLIEAKFGLKMNEEYFSNVLTESLINDQKLGDIILQIRFSAKFHLQMCAVLSQNNNHSDALKHARLASLMCEDNILKTQILFRQIQEEYTAKRTKKAQTIKTNFIQEADDFSLFEEKIRDAEFIFSSLVAKIKNYKAHSLEEENSKEQEKNSEQLRTIVRKVLLVKNSEDWTALLNIGNIMYLSALNMEDLDLDSDPKFELLRDAIIEKIIMLTVSYFCVATEIRFLVESNQNLRNDSELWHYKALDVSHYFLPGSCPIVKHYISSYNKHYTSSLSPIVFFFNYQLEDEVCDHRIETIHFDFYSEEDSTTLFRSVKIKTQNEENKENSGTSSSFRPFSIRENPKLVTSREDQIKMKEIESKMSQINPVEKASKTRNIVSPTKFQTTQYTIVKKSLTPFIFTSSNKEDLTLSKSKLEKENQTKKLYLSTNANTSNGKIKIKNINSLKYINTSNFLKFKVKDKDSKLPLLKISSKEVAPNLQSKTTTFLSPPKNIAGKKVKIKSITTGPKDSAYMNTITTPINSETFTSTNILTTTSVMSPSNNPRQNAVSSKMFENKIINQIFKKDTFGTAIRRQNTPSSLTKISIKK